LSQKVIEVLLYTPKALFDYHDILEEFIVQKLENNQDIKIKMVNELSKDTKIVISLVTSTLGENDKVYYQKYQNRALRFLFYYFHDIEIDDFSDEVFDRIEFKSKIERDTKLYNSFENLEDIKSSLEINLKESLFDIEHKTNYSQINSSVISRSKGSRFYDSDNNLRKVDSFLRRTKRVSLINGFGGVGKTTLAIEYAKDALENGFYDYLIWLDIEKGIDSEIKTFAIKFLLSDMEDGKQEFIYYQKTFERFIEKYPNSLIILDNYSDSIKYQKRLKRFLDNFSFIDIIITARKDISKIVDVKPIKLEVFQTVDDALEMFRLNSTRDYSTQEEQSIRQIIQYLGNLPLALEITANFLDDTDMSVDDYLHALKKEGLKLFDKISDYKPKNHLEGLIATLKINEKIRDNQDTLKLLKAFALISPEPINQNIVEEYLVKELDISPFDKVVSLQDLEKFSYIKLSKDKYSIHRLLQESIIYEFLIDNQNEQKEIIIKISLAIFNWFRKSFEEYNYGTYYAETVKHIKYLLDRWSSIIPNEAKIYLYTCLSAYSDKPKEQLEYIEKAIVLLEEVDIGEREKGIVYNQYGNVLNSNSKHIKALEYYQKSLEINLKLFGSNHSFVANNYGSIGLVYNNMKEYDKALEYHNKSLELNQKLFGINHPAIASNYSNISLFYKNMKEYDKALEYHNKSLKISLLTLGENHPSTSTDYNNIGLIYNYTKNNRKALEYYKKSLDIKLQTIGEYHPNTATTYRNIGFLYKYLKECKNAKESLEKALKIWTYFEIDKYILDLKAGIKSINKDIKNEKKIKKYNKKGKHCKDA